MDIALWQRCIDFVVCCSTSHINNYVKKERNEEERIPFECLDRWWQATTATNMLVDTPTSVMWISRSSGTHYTFAPAIIELAQRNNNPNERTEREQKKGRGIRNKNKLHWKYYAFFYILWHCICMCMQMIFDGENNEKKKRRSRECCGAENRTKTLTHNIVGSYWEDGYLCPVHTNPTPKCQRRSVRFVLVAWCPVCVSVCALMMALTVALAIGQSANSKYLDT